MYFFPFQAETHILDASSCDAQQNRRSIILLLYFYYFHFHVEMKIIEIEQ